ncbi:homocysteine S-methyltransferase family protein [Ruegeria sp. 2012CJ41-6]|uniref:Homocysteine S-methyltransferase family protein n=1 Tax=Ruegeria spongiae TaxID=2942209 RepID=A0ABT0Q798_9RHOB|nr:homocysteine S-methyltransferase family protein [Ruegeria spongiae]MCL6285751.1 homocysteine S-methyltransferase family protein [Ruegeria spongiae]
METKMIPVKLPHQSDLMFLTDAGLETWLLFERGFEMPCFAAYPLAQSVEGRAAFNDYFSAIFDIARQNGTGFVLDTYTWRANPDWGRELGHDLTHLRDVNTQAVESAKEMRNTLGAGLEVLVNGIIGPRGDGYDPKSIMTVAEAQVYHAWQIDVLASAGVDMVSALTLTNVPEAIGFANAAAEIGVPCVVSFTLETDGRLPTGELLQDAIAQVDDAATAKPAYFMVNCIHPDHFDDTISESADWKRRIGGLRANASRLSHAELDCCETLDDGNPVELGNQYAQLRKFLPNLRVVGGCCGTDQRHLAQICTALAS